MPKFNRQWLLGRRPEGSICTEDFSLKEEIFANPELAEGEILVHSRLFRVTPSTRAQIMTVDRLRSPGSVPPLTIGNLITGFAAAEVVDSADAEYPVGTIVATSMGWQDYAVLHPQKQMIKLRTKPSDMSVEDFEGLFGGNALTAYFGLLRVGEARPGDTVLVSSAAGSVGSMVVQLAKIRGCRVIGIVGSAEKCEWLRNEIGLDATIDYKSDDVSKRLQELCPNGADLFFDNVGGSILSAAIENMAPFGRIVLCGQIASYDSSTGGVDVPQLMRVIYSRLKMQGFLTIDYSDEYASALMDLQEWARQGKLTHRTEVHHGFNNLPHVLQRLFDGSSQGTLLVYNE